MALKLIRRDEPIEIGALNVVVYGQPGIGKTTYAFTAKNPILLDFDRGSHRAMNRLDVLAADQWRDVLDMDSALFDGHDTVVVDTVGRAVDMLKEHLWQDDPRNRAGSSLSLKGLGSLKMEFTAWLARLSGKGRDIVMTSHSKEQSKGDETVVRLDIFGGSRDEVYKVADMMGEMSPVERRRLINWSPTETSYGKNPGQLEATEIRDPGMEPDALAKAIEATRSALSRMGEEKRRETKRLNELSSELEKAVSDGELAEWWTERAQAMNADGAPPQDKKLLNAAARRAGYAWSRDVSGYTSVQAEA